MARRTTASKVADLLPNVEDSDSLEPHIDTATALTDWLESKDSDSELNATLLERIEAYLSAHFYAHKEQLLQSEGKGKSSATFQGQTAMVLMSTQHGQTACALDVTGRLAKRSMEAQNGRQRVQMLWGGTEKYGET